MDHYTQTMQIREGLLQNLQRQLEQEPNDLKRIEQLKEFILKTTHELDEMEYIKKIHHLKTEILIYFGFAVVMVLFVFILCYILKDRRSRCRPSVISPSGELQISQTTVRQMNLNERHTTESVDSGNPPPYAIALHMPKQAPEISSEQIPKDEEMPPPSYDSIQIEP